ncbi:hypothetical protein DDP54_16090 (plasmid) [Cellulomonas sp. WB94]|uniref:hypothetical protein n=1 Tax=Cellulomonas sp. WB94 TaxID=2173174 RepID=UPI000D5746BD|nr:hypothetical protein [Cellulomonas sp. WB94]PVU81407.1 hypothetical protein DDP54_16090 [Cellulomonas sp. WB94]
MIRSPLTHRKPSRLTTDARAGHTDRVTDGTVAPTGITTASGALIGAGDRVLTRQNARRLRTSGGTYVRNGDLWDVVATHPDGSLTVLRAHRSGSGPAGNDERSGTLRLAPDYVAEYVDLGYATTTHRAQGITVDQAHVLPAPGMTRENLYVAMTRGSTRNHAYVAIDGVDAACDRLPDPAGDSPGRDILTRILATEGAELSATQTLARALDDAESLHHLEPIRQTLATDAATRRWHTLLPACHLDPKQIAAISGRVNRSQPPSGSWAVRCGSPKRSSASTSALVTRPSRSSRSRSRSSRWMSGLAPRSCGDVSRCPGPGWHLSVELEIATCAHGRRSQRRP